MGFKIPLSAEDAQSKTFRVVPDNGHPVDITVRWIPPGSFLMGSPEGEEGRFSNEGPQHEVTIAQGFWMGEVPVTQALYEAVMGHNPSHFKGDARRPVEKVYWKDAEKFCALLGPEWRLPTEAEWEYACRAGTQGPSYAPDVPLGELCWYKENSQGSTHQVGLKRPNAWGLHDMLGNVWEWCMEPHEPIFQAMRGGSWRAEENTMRPASRHRVGIGVHGWFLGFRLVLG